MAYIQDPATKFWMIKETETTRDRESSIPNDRITALENKAEIVGLQGGYEYKYSISMNVDRVNLVEVAPRIVGNVEMDIFPTGIKQNSDGPRRQTQNADIYASTIFTMPLGTNKIDFRVFSAPASLSIALEIILERLDNHLRMGAT